VTAGRWREAEEEIEEEKERRKAIDRSLYGNPERLYEYEVLTTSLLIASANEVE